MFKIAIGAVGLIAIIVSVGFFYLLNNNDAMCEEMKKSFNERLLSYNQSAENYAFRANTLGGQFDLPGDLLAWQNHLLNERTQLESEMSKLEDRCGSAAR